MSARVTLSVLFLILTPFSSKTLSACLNAELLVSKSTMSALISSISLVDCYSLRGLSWHCTEFTTSSRGFPNMALLGAAHYFKEFLMVVMMLAVTTADAANTNYLVALLFSVFVLCVTLFTYHCGDNESPEDLRV